MLAFSPSHASLTAPTLRGLHLVVAVLRAGVLVLHGSSCCTHGCLLGCFLDMRVLPGSCGPLLLSFGHAGPTAAVEVVNLKWKRKKKEAISGKPLCAEAAYILVFWSCRGLLPICTFMWSNVLDNKGSDRISGSDESSREHTALLTLQGVKQTVSSDSWQCG